MDYRLEAGLWVALSVGLFGLWTGYLARFVDARRPQALWAEVLQELAFGLYFLGIPTIALIRGAVLPRFMGLTHLDWIGGIGPSIQAAFFFGLLLLAIKFIRGEVNFVDRGASSLLVNLKEALYLQVHWALYRAFAAPLLGLSSGVLAGWAISLAEGLLYILGERRRGPEHCAILLRFGSLAVVTGVVFLFSRNFFYCLALHWLLAEMMGRIKG